MNQNKRPSGYKQGSNSYRNNNSINNANNNRMSNRSTNNGRNNFRGVQQYRRPEHVDHAKQEENALYLTNNPSNLYEWKDKFLTYACAKYGDAGVALRTGELPEYMTGDQFEDNRNVPVPRRRTIEYEIYKTELDLEIKRWYKQRTDYNDKRLQLYHDIWAHISDESKQMVKQYVENFDEMEQNADTIQLWYAIEESHLSEGVDVNPIMKMNARKNLENLYQRDGQPLHEYEREFDKRVKICRGVNLELDERELIISYISSLDSNIFRNTKVELLSKVNDENQFPQTLHDAKRLMREILGAHKLVVKRQSMINKTYQNSGTKRSTGYNRDDRFANNAKSGSYNMNQGVQSKKPWDNMKYAYCHKIGHSTQRRPELSNEHKSDKRSHK
jgi:hypothetical protein